MKIGLALGGGVGYGFAHIGVLKALEKHKIVPDIITGTSVGSLIGGIYASGVPVKDLEKIAMDVKWVELLKLVFPKEGLVSLDNLEEFIHSSCRCAFIQDTKIKFAVVATNLLSSKETVFEDGPLTKTIRASCSLPGIFTPAFYRDSVFVDGGITNNVPVDVTKKLGADFVIGVDVLAKARTDILKNLDIFNITWKSFQIMIQERTQLREYGEADHIIMPEIGEINPFDLTLRKKIIALGEDAVERDIKVLQGLIRQKASISGKIKSFFKK